MLESLLTIADLIDDVPGGLSFPLLEKLAQVIVAAAGNEYPAALHYIKISWLLLLLLLL